jgi:hypothetical protein
MTLDTLFAAPLAFFLPLVTICTVQQQRTWIISFILSLLSYNTLFQILGYASDAECSTLLCSGLQDPLKCIVGDRFWVFESIKVLTSVSTIFLCFHRPSCYIFSGQLPFALIEALRVFYAATVSIISCLAILMRAAIFKHLSSTVSDQNFFLFFVRPVMYFLCLLCIEYGVSVCLLRKSGSVLQKKIFRAQLTHALMAKASELNEWYLSMNQQKLLKSSNTPLTYACAFLFATLLIVLHVFDPITGKGGIEHQILQAFWLDFDIIISLSGPLTVLLIVSIYTTWLTNGLT